MKADYLVCYDITEPRRLSRVYRYMKGKGLHIQYSVFHCRMTWPQLLEMKERLETMINEKKDDVRIYPLPANSVIAVIGVGSRVPEGVEVFMD